MSENFNIIITLNYEVLGINVRMEVVDDMQVLEMFKYHNTIGIINCMLMS